MTVIVSVADKRRLYLMVGVRFDAYLNWASTKEKVAVAKLSTKNSAIAATGGKVKLIAGGYKAGDTILVTAKIPSAGVQSRMTFKVVNPSVAVEIRNDKSENKDIFTVGSQLVNQIKSMK